MSKASSPNAMSQSGPNVRFLLNVTEMEKATKTKELGVLDRSNLSEEDFDEFEQRAKGWDYMVNFDHMDDAIGRYSKNKDARVDMSGGGMSGTYTFTSKEAADNLLSILNAAKASKPPFSHVDLMGSSGGKFYIAKDSEEAVKLDRSPWQTEENFLKMYALASLYGHKTWLVEQKLDIFRYFLDLDFKQPGILLPSKIEAVVFIVIRALSKFFPDASSDLLNCICSSTVCKVDRCKACLCECQGQKDCDVCKGVGNTGKKGTQACPGCGGEFPVTKKTGIHLHFPNIYITAEKALDMRETVIAECTRVWGFRASPLNSWGEVIDESVYKKSGLRMMCANKGEPCKQCKAQQPGEVCPACKNSRRLDQGRPYFPLACFNGRGLRDIEKEHHYESHFIELIQDTSIRYFGEETPGFTLYEGAPTASTSLKVKPTLAVSKLAGKKRVISDTGNLLSHQLALDAPEVKVIQSFFSEQSVKEKHCSPVYQEVVVSQVKYKKKDSCYKVDVTGRNSRYCMNKGDHHGGNRVYFLFQASTKDHSQGVVQKCYCEKDEMRKYCACPQYTSSPMTMSHKISSVLFSSQEPQSEEASVLTRMDFRGMSREARSQNQLLLNAGNFLCKDLYNTLWTNSQRFCSMFGSSMLETSLPKKLSVYRPFQMDSVGPDDERTLVDLGFQPEQQVEEIVQKKPKEKRKMETIEKRLNSIVTNILGVALHHDETKILECLHEGKLSDLARGVPDAPDFQLENCLSMFIKETQRLKGLHANVTGQTHKQLDSGARKQLVQDLCESMKNTLFTLLVYRHDTPMENSHRHTGFGWSLEVVDKQFREKTREIIKQIHDNF
jgi:hypothetical protein